VDIASLLDRRLLLVTGKGGVGKSAVAAAVAVASARSGRRTCLVEVEGRHTFSQLFGTQAWDFSEWEFRPDLFGLSIDPEASLREYLDMFYGARHLSRVVVRSTAVEFATAAAPGIKDVLLIGKVKEMERRRDDDGHFHYDLIVVDAPPTGRIVNFLRAPDATTELVNLGPIRTQAQTLIDMLMDAERTNVVLVTLLEEMPVTETLEGAHALRDLGVALGPVVVNRVMAERFDDDERKAITADLDPAGLQAMLADAGVEVSQAGAADLLTLAAGHLGREELQHSSRALLERRLGLPLLELPELYTDDFAEREVGLLADAVAAAVAPEEMS
jgi:anion-transporting  ArsA/GET3 family ATPase